jgi:hypothetical protein
VKLRALAILCALPVGSAVAESFPHKLWNSSVAALAVANAADVASSWGKRELNPIMPEQRFGAEDALVKAGIVGAFMGVEYAILRHHPWFKRKVAALNWCGAGIDAATVVHNLTVPKSAGATK